MPGAGGPIPVVLCLDVEPAERQLGPDAPRRWAGWELALDWVEQLRPRVRAVTGSSLRVGWFVRCDPQVASAFGSAAHPFTAHRDLVERAREAGDRFGIHPHGWRLVAPAGRWVDDQGDPEWVDRCIDVSLDAFAEGLGEPCRLSRMGSRFMSDRVAARLGRRGIELDVTVEPGWSPVAAADRPDHTAALPDYRRVPRHPYRPSAADFRRPARTAEDAVGPVFLPLAVAPLRSPRGIRQRVSAVRRRGWAARRELPLSLSRIGGDESLAGRAVDAALTRSRPSPLAFGIRTDWDRVPAAAARVARSIDVLLSHAEADRLRWVDPHEAVTTTASA